MLNPTVPLQVAELLHVSLSVASQSKLIDSHTRSNICRVVRAYRRERDESLKAQDFHPDIAGEYTEAAAEALANWLEERANLTEAKDDAAFLEFAEGQIND